MRIINASYEILHTTGCMLKDIERVARVCYKSEDKIQEGSAEKMVASLVRRNHEAMLEHYSLIFKIEDFQSYMKFVEYCGFVRSMGGVCMLNATYMKDRGIVSGNIRMWRDFVRSSIALLYDLLDKDMLVNNDPLVPKIIADLVAYKSKWPIVFDGLDLEFNKFDGIKIFDDYEFIEVDSQDLTDEEKKHHMTLTVKFIVDRGISHEIVRHRIASFAQESTRYCNYTKDGFGAEITVIKPCFFEEGTDAYAVWEEGCKAAEMAYMKLISLGRIPQEARDVLPTSTKTEIVVTATINEWIHFLNLRALDKTGAAHPQIKEVSIPLLNELIQMYPNLFVK